MPATYLTHSTFTSSLSTVRGAGDQGKQVKLSPASRCLTFWSSSHPGARAQQQEPLLNTGLGLPAVIHSPTRYQLSISVARPVEATPLPFPRPPCRGSPVSGLEYSRHSTSASWASTLTSSSMKCSSWILRDICFLLYPVQSTPHRLCPDALPLLEKDRAAR